MSPVRKVVLLTILLIFSSITASSSPMDHNPLLGNPDRYAMAQDAVANRDLHAAVHRSATRRDLHASTSALTDANSGMPIGTSFLIEDQPSDLSNPSVAYDSYLNEYWVVYQANANHTIRAARLNARGKVLSYTEIAYHEFQYLQNPDLAYNNTTHAFLVVWDSYDGSRNRIYSRILDPAGVLGPETELGAGDCAARPIINQRWLMLPPAISSWWCGKA